MCRTVVRTRCALVAWRADPGKLVWVDASGTDRKTKKMGQTDRRTPRIIHTRFPLWTRLAFTTRYGAVKRYAAADGQYDHECLCLVAVSATFVGDADQWVRRPLQHAASYVFIFIHRTDSKNKQQNIKKKTTTKTNTEPELSVTNWYQICKYCSL